MGDDGKFEVLRGRPLILPSRVYIFPEAGDEVERDALYVLVRPEGADPWLGVFALGYASPLAVTGAFATADRGRLLVVSGGYPYLADVETPDATELLSQEPVLWIGQSTAPELLLMADSRRVTAIGRTGIAWRTAALSSEGLTDLRVDGDTLHGCGWDAISDREVPFVVDLHTGELRANRG